jgi:hypothetical protein
MSQPVPTYREADLERVVARDYPAELREEVRELLARYGGEAWHREPLRVRMACLKIADGDVPALRRAVGTAYNDYRDVLCTAEYQRYARAPDAAARERAIDRDWTELQDWLERE